MQKPNKVLYSHWASCFEEKTTTQHLISHYVKTLAATIEENKNEMIIIKNTRLSIQYTSPKYEDVTARWNYLIFWFIEKGGGGRIDTNKNKSNKNNMLVLENTVYVLVAVKTKRDK